VLGVLQDCNQRVVCVSTGFMAPKDEEVPSASQASREGGCGVVGWQDLKIESGDIAYLTPRAREDPPALRTTLFQEGEDDEDIGTPGRPTICDN
jgi:hypothetical protein